MKANTIDLFRHERVTPSVDKLTLCGHSSCDILHDNIENLVAKYGENKYLYEEYESKRFMSFVRLIKISYKHFYENGSHEVFTLTIMIGFNGMNMCGSYDEQHKFQIEFNPNKFVIPDWLSYYFIKHDYKIELIKDIDLAFDFEGFDKTLFRYALNNGNTTTAQIGTQNNKTDYIGFSEKANNRIKIYDKKKERAKYYDMPFNTTRVEITLQYKHDLTKGSTLCGDSSFHIQNACDALKQIFIPDNVPMDAMTYALSCLSSEQFNTALSLMAPNSRTKYKKLVKEKNVTLSCDFFDMFSFLYDAIDKILKDNCFLVDEFYYYDNSAMFDLKKRYTQ